MIYALSVGETLYAFDQEGVSALVWRIGKNESSQRALQPQLINVTDLLEKIAHIKVEFPEFPRLLQDLKGENAILDRLAEFLLFGGDPYKRSVTLYGKE
ncbi:MULTISPECIES: hypothetical protein [Sulfolobaceae]|uniref:hypothetical protein n=1 Tax=Sulfolobaceae TaxID=118883 RepID=UPI00163DB29E